MFQLFALVLCANKRSSIVHGKPPQKEEFKNGAKRPKTEIFSEHLID